MWMKRTFKYKLNPLRAISIFPMVIDPRIMNSYVAMGDDIKQCSNSNVASIKKAYDKVKENV